MGLLFKVSPKRCDSQCLVQTSQETRDSKERKKCKDTTVSHSRDKKTQIRFQNCLPLFPQGKMALEGCLKCPEVSANMSMASTSDVLHRGYW